MPGEREACIHFRSSHFPSPPKPRTGPPPAARLAIPTMHEPRHAPRSSQLITKPTPPLSPTARTGLSQYEEEVGYDVVAATVTDSRKGAGAVDEIEFKVVSWRRGADCSAAAADDDTASNFSNDADADSSDSESIASLGSVAAQPSGARCASSATCTLSWRPREHRWQPSPPPPAGSVCCGRTRATVRSRCAATSTAY